MVPAPPQVRPQDIPYVETQCGDRPGNYLSDLDASASPRAGSP
jgi:hypothetical protein